MDAHFPEESVELISRDIEILKKNYNRLFRTPYHFAAYVSSFNRGYSFFDSLRTGNYAHYPHEAFRDSIAGNNCTTIIPEIYLRCEAFGLKPQIVQFFSYRDILRKKDKESPLMPSHFSIVVDVGQKNKYLIDPQYSTFGPIVQETLHYWVVSKHKGKPRRKREFERVLYHSAEEFVQMMERLRDPGESLEVLITGQKIFSRKSIAKIECTLMVYYDDNRNIISTRLAIPQTGISHKAIYCNHELSSQGVVNKTSLDLFVAKEFAWRDLVEGKKVATLDYQTVRRVSKILKTIWKEDNGRRRRFQSYDRLGPLLEQDDSPRRELLSIVEKLYQKLSADEKKALTAPLHARTLYEAEKSEQEYLFEKDQFDKRILEGREKEIASREEMQSTTDKLWLIGWKLGNFHRNEVARLKRKRKRIEEQNSEMIREVDGLNYLRSDVKRVYCRTMDKILFSETLKGLSPEQLEEGVRSRGLDLSIGYLAMIIDFFPHICEGKDELTLRNFLPSIQEKVRARKSPTTTDKTAQTPAETGEGQLLENTLLEAEHRLYDLSFF